MTHNAHLGAVADKPEPLFALSNEAMAEINHVMNTLGCVNDGYIRMMHDFVLIRLQAPERHSHGLWIPDSAKREAYELWRGIVVAVGPGARRVMKSRETEISHPTPIYKQTFHKTEVQPGDVVLFYWLAGKAATRYPDDNSLIISEDQIQCVLEECA